jgi:hypothetical protein
MRPIETITWMGEGGMKENDGVYHSLSSVINCKNFCKCHNVPQVQQ